MDSCTQQMMKEFRSLLFWRAVLAEFVGMILFLYMGISAITYTVDPDKLRIAFAFGIGIATFVHVTAHISGGHLNPAVTIAFFFLHKITALRAIMYVLAQIVGAVIGTSLVRAVTSVDVNRELGPTVINPALSIGQGFLVEVILTFQLVLTIFATVDGNRASPGGSGPLAIGLSVFLGHIAGIDYTGASMNPARSFGSAVVGGNWSDHWVYWVAPILGGIIAAIIYDWFLDPTADLSRVKKVASCDFEESANDTEQPQVELGSAEKGKYNTFDEGAAS